MIREKLYKITFLYVLFACTPLYASFLGDLGVVEVRGERDPRLQAETALSIESVYAGDIEGTGKKHIASILDENLGMHIHYTGGGSHSGMAIRGISGGQTNNKASVYLDGAPVSTMRRGFVLESFTPGSIERMDLIKGPASALFGAGSLSGGLNITSSLRYEDSTTLNIRRGSFSEISATALLNRASEKYSSSVGGTYETSDGHDTNPSTLLSGYGMFELDTSGGSVFFTGRVFSAERESPIYASGSGAFMGMEEDHIHNLGLFRIGINRDLGGDTASARIYYNTESEESSTLNREESDSVGGVFEYFRKGKSGRRMYVGANISYDEFRGDIAKNRFSYSPYIQGVIPVNAFRLTAGARYDAAADESSLLSPHISLNRRISDYLGVSVGYNHGFRRPTVSEFYSKRLRLFGDPKLKPEEAKNIETSFFYRDPAKSIRINLFRTEVSNLIISREPEVPLFHNGQEVERALKNVEDISVYQGVEVSADLDISSNLSAGFRYSYLDPGTLTFHTSAHSLLLKLNVRHASHSLTLTSTGRFKRYLWDDSEGELNDLLLFGITYNYRISPNLRLYISGENLSDEEYSLYFHNPMPGSRIAFGASMEF